MLLYLFILTTVFLVLFFTLDRKKYEQTEYYNQTHNCYLPKSNSEKIEVDVILIHESDIYVLEFKNYSGWIFGAETEQY